MPNGITARHLLIVLIAGVAAVLSGCTAASSPSPSETVTPLEPLTLRSVIDAEPESPTFELVQETTDFDGDAAEVVSYESGGFEVQAVIRRPVDAASPAPAVILVHGTADPEEYSGLTDYDDLADGFVDRGYVVVMPDLRNYADSEDDPRWETDIDIGGTLDVINAARAAAVDPGVDPSRIALMGHSSGGTMVINAAVAAPEVATAVVAAAPASATAWTNIDTFLSGTPFYDEVVAAHGTPEDSPDFWRDVSSLTFVDRAQAPLLVVHGEADVDVPHEWSAELVDEWIAAGKDAQFEPIVGADHSFDEPGNSLQLIEEFLATRML